MRSAKRISSMLSLLLTASLGLPVYGLAQEPAPAPAPAAQTDTPAPTAPSAVQTDTAPAPAAQPAAQAVGPDGKPLPPPAKGKGKAVKKKKEKPPKMTPVSISRGVLTVDGWAGKAAMNYDIADLKFIYISAPGIGTAVISNVQFPGAKEQPKAFDDTSLKITAAGHTLEVSSDKRLLGKKPASAWVLVDSDYTYPSTFPTMGYGTTTKAPYVWPGSKPNVATKGIAEDAAPVPVNLRPTLIQKPCLPGKVSTAAAPCVAPAAKPASVTPVSTPAPR